jgi:hypothetical protein
VDPLQILLDLHPVLKLQIELMPDHILEIERRVFNDQISIVLFIEAIAPGCLFVEFRIGDEFEIGLNDCVLQVLQDAIEFLSWIPLLY